MKMSTLLQECFGNGGLDIFVVGSLLAASAAKLGAHNVLVVLGQEIETCNVFHVAHPRRQHKNAL